MDTTHGAHILAGLTYSLQAPGMPCHISRCFGPYLLLGALYAQQNTLMDPDVLLDEQKYPETLHQV